MSTARVDAVITKLRAFVAEGRHHGLLVEDVKRLPRGVNLTGVEQPGAWLGRARPARPVPAWLPADYRHFVARWGSLTWLAPEDGALEDEWFYLGNTGDKTLIDLNERFDLHEAAEAAGRGDDPALAKILVFHDGYNEGFAFDARVRRGARGEVLVVPFVEDELAVFLGKRRPKPVGTFAEWLEARVTRCIAALSASAPPVRATTTKVPASIPLPSNRGIDLEHRADVDPGWPLLAKGQFAKVAVIARTALQRDPVFLYAHAQLLDALAGLAATAKAPRPLHEERYTIAWTLLGLARRGVDNIHADYHKMFRQKALTVLAELAFVAPDLVSIPLAKQLIAEAGGLRVESSFGAGTWDTRGVKQRLDKVKA